MTQSPSDHTPAITNSSPISDEGITITKKICELIGYDLVRILCDELGGLRWKIPRRPPKELRDARIREEFERAIAAKTAGTTHGIYEALATKHALYVDTVRKIVAEREKKAN